MMKKKKRVRQSFLVVHGRFCGRGILKSDRLQMNNHLPGIKTLDLYKKAALDPVASRMIDMQVIQDFAYPDKSDQLEKYLQQRPTWVIART